MVAAIRPKVSFWPNGSTSPRNYGYLRNVFFFTLFFSLSLSLPVMLLAPVRRFLNTDMQKLALKWIRRMSWGRQLNNVTCWIFRLRFSVQARIFRLSAIFGEVLTPTKPIANYFVGVTAAGAWCWPQTHVPKCVNIYFEKRRLKTDQITTKFNIKDISLCRNLSRSVKVTVSDLNISLRVFSASFPPTIEESPTLKIRWSCPCA
jgi:hypothetical protein